MAFTTVDPIKAISECGLRRQHLEGGINLVVYLALAEFFETFAKGICCISDSCGGQNRNIIIALFWMFVLQEMNIKCIDHIFLVSGHSFMSCDEDFGVDEREKKKHEHCPSG